MASRASRSNWPLVDTIYCEAKCPKEDVYYSGSDDDQYESPRQRKRRYELAGQRFLAGSAPRLFSASLTGPFESSRGWKNPWASKTQSSRTAQQPNPQIPLATKATDSIKIAKPHIKQIPAKPRADSAECHLPSPQSLKTASLASERHLYLEEEELKAVQQWRDGVCSAEPEPVQPSTTRATNIDSPHKRKSSHNWLRVAPIKRSKTDTSNNSSIASKTRTPTLLGALHGGEQPRLEPGTNIAARESTNQLISPPKQALSTKNTVRNMALAKSKPRSGPHKEQQAITSMSSPVSLRKIKQENPSTELSPLDFKAKAHSALGVVLDDSNTTASHCKASYETVRRPHRVSDDEEFVFNIAFKPLLDSSDSDEDRFDEGSEHVNDEVLQKDERRAVLLNDHRGPERGGSPSSELSELSNSPELSDLEEEFDAAEENSVKGPHETAQSANDDSTIAETRIADAEASSEAINITNSVKTELAYEAEDGSTPEDCPSVDDVPETAKTMEIGVSRAMLEEDTPILSSNEPADETDKNTRQLPQRMALEGDAPVTAAHEVVATLRVTKEASTQSHAKAAVLPSPKVKQEVSEFSLKAILRSFVPPNPWANPPRPSPVPAQSIQEPILEMDELILPSVEDVPMTSPTAGKIDSMAEEDTTSTTDNVPTEEATECQQTVLEKDSSVGSEKQPTPRPQRISTPPAHRTPNTPELDEAMADKEPLLEHHTREVEAEIETQNGALQERRSPLSQETATALSTVACEMAPPVTTPATPLRAKPASPAGKPRNAEPRFAYKSFAAFATPSPERLRVQKRRKLPGSSLRHPNLKGILASMVTGSARRTSNRVSWCLPGESEGCVDDGADALRSSRDVPSSPPPRKPLAELPTASNDKFARHFSSVMKRTDGLRHRFRAAADTDRLVESLSSSSLGASAGPPPKTCAVHARAGEHSGAAVPGDVEPGAERRAGDGQRERTVSVEPMDMVEDMVREMGDFWQSWDVDAELDAAKKTDATTARAGTQSQTSWR